MAVAARTMAISESASGLRWLLCAYAVSLAFMRPAVRLLGFTAVASDLIFAALAGGLGLLIAAGRVRLIADRAFVLTGFYFAAMLVSFLSSQDPLSTPAKLATQLYLLAIPVVMCCLVRDERTLQQVVRAWLVGTAIVVAVGVASLILFTVDPSSPLLDYTRFQFGTLPPGPYPRLQLTFLNANMACNYLSVSLALLLAAGHLGWVSRPVFVVLVPALVIVAVTTISPGFGAILALGGLSYWLVKHRERPIIARLALAIGLGLALLFLPAMAVTPILHPTAPFLIHVPVIDVILAPSPRLMIWMEAAANFLQHPITGRGIGADAVAVRYLDPSGRLQQLTDAHNMFLNIAVQCGTLGLAALLALLVHIVRRTLPLRLAGTGAGVVRLATGLGLLGGLVYQGLGGSFEDSRHLWFALGLLLASSRIERTAGDQTRIGMST
jgi:O-antigen ligase